ncbi:hypothetical protein U0070_015019 [Myodes glareolus]|uniref:Secreted protein n=1 Tax=Myodes glareolus TaxID=447135 RepID=A0AAW0I4R3_MYOGA
MHNQGKQCRVFILTSFPFGLNLPPTVIQNTEPCVGPACLFCCQTVMRHKHDCTRVFRITQIKCHFILTNNIREHSKAYSLSLPLL